MSALRRLIRQRRDARGATVVEFGFIALPLILVLLVAVDFGYRLYLEVVVEGTLNKAARRATVGGISPTQVDNFIKSQLIAFSKNATITIEKKNYYQFSNVGKPEKITQDTAPVGSYNVGDCYEDGNGNGSYDVNSGGNGLGGSDDIVFYKVTVDFPRLVPLGQFLGFSNRETVTANTVLRNQPFASQTVPTVRCT